MKTKTPRAKKPATAAARRMHAKLSALAERPGTPAEGQAAADKLASLEARYNFDSTPGNVAQDKDSLFAGRYYPTPEGRLVAAALDSAIAFWIKWAIETSTPVRCSFRGSDLYANASPKTCEKLAVIVRTITAGFTGLWDQFRTFPAVPAEARSVFLRGLYDGMMREDKPSGQPLPTRPVAAPARRLKRRALGHLAGIELHPYAVALELGKQIRFNVPLPDLAAQLEALRPTLSP